MPDISTIKSPLPLLQNPVTIQRGSIVGSKDTALGRMVGNYYDRGLYDYSTQVDARYNNQGWPTSIFNFAADLGVKTASGAPSVIGSITGLGKGSYSALTGGNFSDGFDDNPFLNMASTVNAWGSDMFPHFQEAAFADMNFGQKVTHPGQLATSNVETLGFLAQSFGLAGLLGKAQIGTRVISQLAKGKSFKAALSMLDNPNLAKIAGAIDEVSMNAFLTTNESALEATQARDSVLEKLHRDRIEGLNNLSDAEMEKQAGGALTNSFWLNMMVGGVTNGFFAKLVKPLYAPSSVASRANKFGLELSTAGEEFAKTGNRAATAFERFLFDKGNSAGMFTKSLLEQGFSEGLEEDLQYSIQKVNEAYNTKGTILESGMAFAKDFLTHGLDFSDKQRAESAGLGALIGAGSTGVVTALGKGPWQDATSFREQRDKALDALNGSYTDFLGSSIFSKNEDTGEFEVDANGQLIKDPVKAAKFAADTSFHSSLDTLMDNEAIAKGDATKVSLYQLSKLNALAKTAFENGSTDMLIKKLESYKDMSPEMLQKHGIENPDEIAAAVDRWVDHVKRLEANYLSTENAMIQPSTSKTDVALHNAMKSRAAELGGHIVNLDRLIQDVDAKLNESIRNSTLAGDRAEQIVKAFAESETLDDLEKYFSDASTAPEETQIAELAAKKKQLISAREDLGEVYTKYLDPRNGFKNFKKAVNSGDLKDFTPKSDAPKTVPTGENINPESLKGFVNKKAASFAYKEKVRAAQSAFYADAYNQWAKYYEESGISKESAASLERLVNTPVENKLNFYPDEAEKLQGIVSDYVEALEKNLATAKKAMDDMGIDYTEQDGEIDYFAQSDEEEEVAEHYSKLVEAKNALGDIYTDPDKTLANIQSLKSFSGIITDPAHFQDQALEDILTSAKGVIDASNYDGQTISEEYDDLSKIQHDLAFLNDLKEKAVNELSKKDSAYAELNRRIGLLQKDLKAIEKLTIKNIENRDLKNKLEDEYYARGIINIWNYSGGQGLTTEVGTKVNKLIALDPVLAAAAITDLYGEEDGADSMIAFEIQIKKEIEAFIKGLPVFEVATGIPVILSDEEISAALESPTKAFGQIFKKILEKETRIDETGGAPGLLPLVNYLKKYNVVEFEKTIKDFAGVTTQEELQKLLNYQAQLLGLAQIKLAASSAFSGVDFYTAIHDYIKANPNSPVPSSSQIRAVKELYLFNTAPNETANELFQNGASLKAPAGAGKSLVISKLLKSVLKLQSNEIMTAAPMALAAQNIKESIDSEYNANTLEELTEMLQNNALPKEVRLLLIDEAGALTTAQINLFASAFAKYNRNNPEQNLKFVFLYDPNQITPGNISQAALDNEFYSDISLAEEAYHNGDEDIKASYRQGESMPGDLNKLAFIHNITSISPLSVTYRTDVSEIVDLQNKFKSAQAVTNIKTSASQNPLASTKDILGTFSESKSTIVERFKRSEAENPARTRTIIVGNQAKKDLYKSFLPLAEVLLVNEAQGITRDEVYVDLVVADNEKFRDENVFNQFMYTALSRAKLFASLSNTTGTSFGEDTTITERVKDIQNGKASKSDVALSTLQSYIDTLKDITGKAPETTSEEIINETPTPTEVPETVTEDEIPTTPEPREPVVNNTHSLWHPDSNTLFETEGTFVSVKPGDELLVVKDITKNPAEGGRSVRYLILQALKDGDQVYGYRKVAILGEKEEGEFKLNTGIPLESLEGYKFEKGLGDFYINTVDEVPITSAHKVFVQPSTHDIVYEYSNNLTDDFSADVEDGKLKTLSLLKRYFETKYGPNPGEVIDDYEDVLKNFEKYTRIISFKTSAQTRKMFPDATSDKERPLLGPPYLIIHGIRSKGIQTKAQKNQFIRLAPAILDRAHSTTEFPLEDVYTFIRTLKKFEAALASSGLKGKYTELRNGVGITIDKAGIYYPFHALVAELSFLYKNKDPKYAELRLTKSPHLIGLFPNVPVEAIPENLLKLANELDTLVHGDSEDRGKRSYKGTAQRAIDLIGRQNLVTTLPNGKNLIFRDYRTISYDKQKGEILESSGFSLLGPLSFERDGGLPFNPLIKDNLIKRLTAYRDGLISKGKQDSSRFLYIDTLLKTKGNLHLNPITTEDLSQLFEQGTDSKGKFSNLSEGFGLRTPMLSQLDSGFYDKSMAPGAGIGTIKNVDVQGRLETYFDRVVPTQIVVGTSPNMVQSEAPKAKEAKKFEPLDALRFEVRNTKATPKTLKEKFAPEVVAAFTGFMEATSFEAAVKEYRENTTKAGVYVTNATNIYQALRAIGKKDVSLAEQIQDDLNVSTVVTGIGKGAGKTSARDFIRGSVIVQMFGNLTQEQLFRVSDFVRTDFYSEHKYSPKAFQENLEYLIDKLGADVPNIIEKLNSIIEEYNKISPDQTEQAPKVETLADVFSSLQTIVGISHKIRSLRREGDVPGIEVPEIKAFAKKLMEADEQGMFHQVLNAPENAALKEELSKRTDSEDGYYDVAAAIAAEDDVERSKVMDTIDIGNLLTPEEVEAELKRLQPPTLWKTIKSLFVKSPKTQAHRIVAYNTLVNSRGQEVWGLYKNGLMSFAQTANGKVGSKIVRHEFFHKIFWEYLTKAEQTHVLGLAQDKWGNLDPEALEEKLATDFESYAILPSKNIFQVIWDTLLKLLGFTYKNLSSIEKFFESIENNAFNKAYESADVERSATINIAANFDNFKQYHFVKTTLLSSFKRIQEESRKGKAMSFSETISEAFLSLERIRQNPEIISPNITEEEKSYLRISLSKVLDNKKLKKAFVDTFFGQAQTKEALVKLELEITNNQIKALESRVDELAQAFDAGDESIEDELNDAEEELAGLREESFDSELRNPSLKITGVVKQRLVSIEYLKDGVKDYADFQSVFSILLSKLQSMPVTGFRETLSNIKDTFKTFGIVTSKLTPNIRSATGQFMLDLVRRMENTLDGESLRKDVTFRKDASSKSLYAIVAKDKSNVQNVTNYDVQQNPAKYEVIQQIEGQSLDNLLETIRLRLPGSSYGDLRTSYYFFEDMDFTRTLLAAVASLVENRPNIGLDRYDYGKYRLAYFRTKLGGGRQIHESQIVRKFQDYINERSESAILFPTNLLDAAKVAKTTEEKVKVIKSLFNVIGLRRAVKADDPKLIDDLFGNLNFALVAMQSRFSVAFDEANFDSLEEYQQFRSAKELLGDETQFLGGIIELLNTHYQLSETHSYTRGDGKKAFGFTDESYQSGVLTSIARALEGKVHKTFDTFRSRNGKLETDDVFLKKNIYFNGTSSIKSVGSHDSIKRKGNEKFAKYLRKETLSDFRKRHFAAGFLNGLQSSKTGFYKQFLPIPANRTTIQFAEVKALKGADLDNAILKILAAQQSRPEPNSNPKLANNAAYVRNYQQWRFSGLEGSNNGVNVKTALAQVKANAKLQAQKAAQAFHQKSFDKQPQIPLEQKTLEKALQYFGFGSMPDINANSSEEAKQAFLLKKNELITSLYEQFYLNFAVNQYSLAQLLYGDEAFYASKEDQTKRIQIATATGDRLLVDEEFGIPKKSRILVVQDPELKIPTDLEGVIKDSYGDTYEPSDAEGFMTPEFYEKVARTYGIESSTDIAMKPVYFSIENGVPLAVKYSVKVLTDELVAKFPHLAGYRQAMRDSKADQMVFASAVKIGKPKGLAAIDSYSGEIKPNSVKDTSFIELNNENFRFQLNPAKSVDIDTRNPSQGTAFMNTNGKNTAESFQLHSLNSFIIENGLRSVHRELRLNRKGKVGTRSANLVNRRVAKSVEGLPGGRDVFELLNARDPETKRGVSLGFPLIASRVVTTIASIVDGVTVGFRFPGSKLILQADLGVQKVWNDVTKKEETRKLQWRDKEGYCEVILPKEYASFMKKGDQFVPGNKDGLVGFRIPSTNYHSMIPMKVVGFYDAPSGAKANVIIAPSLIVYYHGSDYDVDTLFVMRKQTYLGPDVDLNDSLALIDANHEYSEQLEMFYGKTVVGFKEDGPVVVEGKYLHNYLEGYIIKGHQLAENLASQLDKAAGEGKKKQIIAELEELNKTLENFSEIADTSAKNHIVHLFSTNMRDMKNRSDLLTPISFNRIESLRSGSAKELSKLLDTEDFINDLQKAGLIKLKC